MKKIGLIGGTSWHSTIVYYRLINEMVGEKIGDQANPELLIYSLNVELMREHNVDKINQKYLEISQLLQDAGAEALLIPWERKPETSTLRNLDFSVPDPP